MALVAWTAGAALVGGASDNAPPEVAGSSGPVAEGQQIFRFDTFGDEQHWTDTLHMNEVVEQNVATPCLTGHARLATADSPHSTVQIEGGDS